MNVSPSVVSDYSSIHSNAQDDKEAAEQQTPPAQAGHPSLQTMQISQIAQTTLPAGSKSQCEFIDSEAWQKKLRAIVCNFGVYFPPAFVEKSRLCYVEAMQQGCKSNAESEFWNKIRSHNDSQEDKIIKYFCKEMLEDPGYFSSHSVDTIACDAAEYALGQLIDRDEVFCVLEKSSSEKHRLILNKFIDLTPYSGLFNIGAHEVEKIINLVIVSLQECSQWIIPQDINQIFLKAICKTKKISEDKLFALEDLLPKIKNCIIRQAEELRKALMAKAPVFATFLPSDKEMIDLMLPVLLYRLQNIDKSQIDLSLCLKGIVKIFKNWQIHFSLACLKKAISPKEMDENPYSLRSGTCAGISCLHIINRIKDPTASPHANPIFALDERQPFPKFNLTVYPFTSHSRFSAEIDFIHAAYMTARKVSNETYIDFIPGAIAKKHHLLIQPLYCDSKDYPEPILDMTNLMQELAMNAPAIAAKTGQIILSLTGDENKPPHAITIQVKAPYHIMDPKYGIIEFSTLDDLIINLPLFLTAHHPNYRKYLIRHFA